jgi:hypothetical protein
MVAWLEHLIPLLRRAPPDVVVKVEIEREAQDDDLRRDEAD